MHISGTKVAAAFVAARKGMESTVRKDKQANYGKYATLAAVMDVIAAEFSKNDLAVIQEATLTEQGITIQTSFLHTSGEIITFEPLALPLTQRTPQGVGSAISYGRRYQLTALCGIAAEDDDGQEASKGTGDSGLVTGDKSSSSPVISHQSPARKLGSITPAQEKELHALGVAVYNGGWDEQRHKLILHITKDKSESIHDLTQAQATKLITGLHERLRTRILAAVDQDGRSLSDLLLSHEVVSLEQASPVALTHIWRDVKPVEPVPQLAA